MPSDRSKILGYAAALLLVEDSPDCAAATDAALRLPGDCDAYLKAASIHVPDFSAYLAGGGYMAAQGMPALESDSVKAAELLAT